MVSYFLYEIFTKNKQNFISLLLFLSPAFISFYIYDIRGSFRKEFLGIFAFLFLVNNLINQKNIFIPLFLYYFSVFSHPSNLFLFPAFVILLKKYGFNFRPIILFSAPLFFYVGGEFIFANNIEFSKIFFCNEMNSKKNLTLNCNSLDSQFVDAVNSSSTVYLNQTLGFLNKTSSTYYLSSLFLGLCPFFLNPDFFKRNKIIGLYFISYTPLLLLGYDWGRWIVLFLITVSVFYFLDETKPKISLNKILMLFIFIIYSSFWKISHCCNLELFPFSYNAPLIESLNSNLLVLTKIVSVEIFNLIYYLIS